MKIKHIGYLAVLAAALPLTASASYYVQSEGNGGTRPGFGPYQSGNGGEFTFYTDLSVSSYVAGITADIAGQTPPSFQSFCISATSFSPGQKYIATPIPGNANNAGMPLTAGVAWLYSQFATASLAGYNWSPAGPRQATAALLQDEIWALTGIEGQTEANNAGNLFQTEVLAQFGGSWAAADTAVGGGTDGVYVLLLTSANGSPAQSQLWYHTSSVPDGGMTAMLLGGALLGVGSLRRKLAV